jgi:GxxExxY protein
MSGTTDDRRPFDDAETGAILGVAFDVHFKMGRGFLEPIYRECMAIEFRRREIPYVREVAMPVYYDGILLPLHFRADFVCYGSVVVEVKALPNLTAREEAQLMNYLRAARMQRGLILNFGSDRLQLRRRVWNLAADPLKLPPSVAVAVPHPPPVPLDPRREEP